MRGIKNSTYSNSTQTQILQKFQRQKFYRNILQKNSKNSNSTKISIEKFYKLKSTEKFYRLKFYSNSKFYRNFKNRNSTQTQGILRQKETKLMDKKPEATFATAHGSVNTGSLRSELLLGIVISI
ncbi:hypothetical protein M9H77_07250 [Catharanthus roseus]|uniref:Uncharacterized protein n=1 Tax=Catharanthus roseus TaxID=4058 RepID=A0ACC0BUF4_CATRO|nr:hypothetical protein M9H77_07250 [Catharanthus roseus]